MPTMQNLVSYLLRTVKHACWAAGKGPFCFQDTLNYEFVSGTNEYFYLNPATGQLFLIKDLATTQNKLFTVSI